MDAIMKDGIMFMLVGMAVVFSFLVLMVLVMNIAGGILKNFPEEEEKTPTRAPKPKKQVEADGEDEIALAIAIAKARTK